MDSKSAKILAYNNDPTIIINKEAAFSGGVYGVT